MKTIDELNDELDMAIADGDIEMMDRIAAEMDALSNPELTPEPKTDVVESQDDTDASSSVDTEKPAQVDDEPAQKGGKGDDRLVPLSEAKKARQEAAQYREEAATLKAQLAEMQSNPQTDPSVLAELDRFKRLNAVYEDQIKKHDLQPAQLPEEFRLDAEKLAALESYGEIGEVVAMLSRQNEILLGQINSTKQVKQPEKDPVMSAIEADPDLSRWFQSDLAWEEVQKVDRYLLTRPDYAGKPLSERTSTLVDMVKQRLGEAPKTTKTADQIIRESQRKPTSLTDIGGVDSAAEASFAERTADKSETEIYLEMEKMLKSGKSIDDLLSAY